VVPVLLVKKSLDSCNILGVPFVILTMYLSPIHREIHSLKVLLVNLEVSIMPDEFRGTALPLQEEGLGEVIEKLRVGAPEVWAILTVETRGCGFLPDRRPIILFERHVFSRETDKQFDSSDPDISNPEPGGYGLGGAHQYGRLHRAMAKNRRAAIRSSSWGIGQVMGFNAEISGYRDLDLFIASMIESEDHQLLGMAGEIIYNRLDRPLRNHDWTAFARGYNGSAYAKNHYDTRLAAAYNKYIRGPLPDLWVRAAQVYLTYLGYNPGPVDGIMGRFTRSALHQFLAGHQLQVGDEVDNEVLSKLKTEADKLPS
jgi:hypothetical protein